MIIQPGRDVLKPSYVQRSSGVIIPEHAQPKNYPIAVDLFCGAGGFSLGFIQAGFHVIAGVDNDHIAMQTYLMNLGSYPVNLHFIEEEDREKVNKKMEREISRSKDSRGFYRMITSGSNAHRVLPPGHPPVSHFWYGDVKKLKGQDMLDALGLKQGDIDVVMGGPPCQGFSFGGKRNVHDPRNSLVWEFIRLCHELAPKTFVMENVPGIASMITPEGVNLLDALCMEIEQKGFGTYDRIREALTVSSGMGVAVRGRTVKDSKSQESEEDPDAPQQMSLIGDEE